MNLSKNFGFKLMLFISIVSLSYTADAKSYTTKNIPLFRNFKNKKHLSNNFPQNSGTPVVYTLPSTTSNNQWIKVGTFSINNGVTTPGDYSLNIQFNGTAQYQNTFGNSGLDITEMIFSSSITADPTGFGGAGQISKWGYATLGITNVVVKSDAAGTAAKHFTFYINVNQYFTGYYVVTTGNNTTWTDSSFISTNPGSNSSTVASLPLVSKIKGNSIVLTSALTQVSNGQYPRYDSTKGLYVTVKPNISEFTNDSGYITGKYRGFDTVYAKLNASNISVPTWKSALGVNTNSSGVDTAAVHLAGAETVSGSKTFTSGIKVTNLKSSTVNPTIVAVDSSGNLIKSLSLSATNNNLNGQYLRYDSINQVWVSLKPNISDFTNNLGYVTNSQQATASFLGMVKVPSSGGLNVDGNGNLSVNTSSITTSLSSSFLSNSGGILGGGLAIGSVSQPSTPILQVTNNNRDYYVGLAQQLTKLPFCNFA
jgi:hypothetical protein